MYKKGEMESDFIVKEFLEIVYLLYESSVLPFKDSLNKLDLINAKGDVICKAQCDNIIANDNYKTFTAEKNGNKFVLTAEGRVIVNTDYKEITRYCDNLFAINSPDSSIAIYDDDRNEILKPGKRKDILEISMFGKIVNKWFILVDYSIGNEDQGRAYISSDGVIYAED